MKKLIKWVAVLVALEVCSVEIFLKISTLQSSKLNYRDSVGASRLDKMVALNVISLSDDPELKIGSLIINAQTLGAGEKSTPDDNLKAINTAVRTVSEAGGGTVYLPSGKYEINGSVRMYSNVTLRGDGKQTRISCVGGDYITIINADIHAGNDNIVVRDLALDGHRKTRKTGAGIRFIADDMAKCENIRLYRVSLTNIPYAAIQLMNVRNVLVRECIVDSTSRDAITIWFNSSDIEILGNTVSNSRDDCIALNAEAESHVGTKIYNVSIKSNKLGQASDSVYGTGIRVSGAENVAVIGNLINYAQGWGILVEGGMTSKERLPSRRVFISGNKVLRSGSPLSGCGGLATTVAALDIQVIDNDLSNYYGNGIQCAGATRVINNRVETGQRNSSVGIYITGAGSYVSGNTVNKSASHGIMIGANYVSLEQNILTECGILNPSAVSIIVSPEVTDTSILRNVIRRKNSLDKETIARLPKKKGYIIEGNIFLDLNTTP